MVYIRRDLYTISSVLEYCASINIHTAPHNYRTAYTQHVSYDTFIEHASMAMPLIFYMHTESKSRR